MAAMVKSVELVEYSFTTTSGSVNLTKGQDYTNCVPFMTLHGSQDYMDSHYTDIHFGGTVASGTLIFERDETRSATLSIKCYVVEFDSAEVKVQHGSFNSLASGSTTAYNTPSSFTQSKTAMVHYWSSTSSTRIWGIHQVRGRVLSNGTQVDMYRNRSGGTVSGHYFLFEDISVDNDHFIVDHQDKTCTGTAIDFEIPAGQRDITRTFTIASVAGSDGSAGYNERQTGRVFSYFKSLTRFDRSNATNTMYPAVQHVTFQDMSRVYVVYQSHNSIAGAATTNSNTWSRACDLNKSIVIPTIVMGQARGTTTNAAEIDSLFVSMKLSSSTQIDFERNSSGYSDSTCYFGYAIVDWSGAIVNTGVNLNPIDPDISFVKSVENIRMSVDEYQVQVDLSKAQTVSSCAIFASQRNSSGNANIRESMFDVWLRDPGVIVAKRNDSGGTGIVDISVVEFYPDQVKVQTGEWMNWSTTTETAEIEPVSSLDNTFAIAKWECNDATYWSRAAVRVRFTTTSGLEFYRNNSGNTVAGTFYVVEDLADNFRVGHSIYTATGSTANHWDYTQNAFHQFFQCLPITSYTSSTNSYYVDRATCRARSLGDGSRAICDRHNTSDTIYVSFQFVRFLDERDHVSVMSPTFGTSDVSFTQAVRSINVDHKDLSISTYNPMLLSVGRGTATGSDDMRGVFVTYRLINNNTEIEMTREATVGITCYPSYGGAIDWIGYTHPDADEKHQLNYAYPTKSLVRSMEKFTYTGTGRVIEHYLTKGQRPENCVPFCSWRVGANSNEMDRLSYNQHIDINSRLTLTADGGPNGGDLDEISYVVEFDPGQVRVQQIYQLMTGTSYNVTIPHEVDLTKTFLWFSYCTDHWTNQWRYHLVTGSFLSSTELNFSRNVSSNGVYLTIYLVECLQDQWYVSHYNGGSDGDTLSYDSHNFKYNSSARLIQGSYSTDNAVYYPDRCCYRLYPNNNDIYQYIWNRYNSTGNQTDRHSEVLQFNNNIDARVFGSRIDIPGGSSSELKTIGTIDGIDLTRSIVCPTVVNGSNRVDGTAADDIGAMCVKLEITDVNDFTFTKYDKGIYTYGFAQLIEWPAYKTHYFEGVVTEKSIPIIRQVACFRADTNELMDSTVSISGTGFYHLETTYSGSHYIVCQDDDPPIDYNHLILGKMEPYPLPTFSGGEIIYG